MACKACEERRRKLKQAGAHILEKLRRRERIAVSNKRETEKNEPKKRPVRK